MMPMDRPDNPPAAAPLPMSTAPTVTPGGDGIALALSGGGMRALAFHLGVLRLLAEQGLLERVTQVSSVSGGSLAVGLVMVASGGRWPDSPAFLDAAGPAVRGMVCSRSLMNDALAELLNPARWRYVLSRANLVSRALQQHWGMNLTLGALPSRPTWQLNATVAEDGTRFAFRGATIGDWMDGYTEAPELPLAEAVAVSAAFPGGIGPLALPTAGRTWWQHADAGSAPAVRLAPPAFATLHLYDGGVYDNLGLEPLFDIGTGAPKHGIGVIIACDAGAPLSRGFSADALNPFRLMRVMDIMSQQTRDLRVRSFVAYLERTRAGAFIAIDSTLLDRATDPDADFACTFPTTLRRLTPTEFDRLAGHGYAVAQRVQQRYGLVGAT